MPSATTSETEVGFARGILTPPLGSEIAGQFLPRYATAVHDDLFARALAIRAGGMAQVLISCDLAAVPAPTVRGARASIAARTGLSPSDCHIFATETHTGPRAHDSLGRHADPEVSQRLPGQLCAVAEEAWSRLQPARLFAATGSLRATYNRRFLMRGGRTVMSPPHGHPDVLGPEGPTDPEVQVLAAADTSGHWLGAVVHWACHPIVVGHESVVSADYPGALERFLRAALDPEFICLFANGASGDLYPFDWYHPERTPYGFPFMERLGRALGAEVVKALSLDPQPLQAGRLRAATRHLAIPLRSLEQSRVAEDEPVAAAIARVYAADRALLEEERAASPVERVEVSCVALDGCLMFFHPAELFCALGLEVKARTAGRRTMVVGRAGGYVGYIPSAEAFAHGGYETRLCRTSKLVPEAGCLLVETCEALAAHI